MTTPHPCIHPLHACPFTHSFKHPSIHSTQLNTTSNSKPINSLHCAQVCIGRGQLCDAHHHYDDYIQILMGQIRITIKIIWAQQWSVCTAVNRLASKHWALVFVQACPPSLLASLKATETERTGKARNNIKIYRKKRPRISVTKKL